MLRARCVLCVSAGPRCSVVQCGVPKALLPEGKGREVLLTGIAKWAGVCVCASALCRGPFALTQQPGSPQHPAVSVQGCSGDSLPLRLLVPLPLP